MPKILSDITYPTGAEGLGKFVRDVDGAGRLDFENVAGVLQWKVVPIDDWNMESQANHQVTVANLDPSTIRSITGLIRSDSNTVPITYYPIPYDASYVFIQRIEASGSNCNIFLQREVGAFNNSSFNDLSYTRGWLTIGHL